jgi:hypothetical protein
MIKNSYNSVFNSRVNLHKSGGGHSYSNSSFHQNMDITAQATANTSGLQSGISIRKRSDTNLPNYFEHFNCISQQDTMSRTSNDLGSLILSPPHNKLKGNAK